MHLIHRLYLDLISLCMILSMTACSDTQQIITTQTKTIVPLDQNASIAVIDISFSSVIDQHQVNVSDQFQQDQDSHQNQPNPQNQDAMIMDREISGGQGLCQSHCDCMNGYGCQNGQCTANVPQAYCCGRMPCPEGADCQYIDGRVGMCSLGQNTCQSACDCPSGQQCQQGRCVLGDSLLYCCSQTGMDCPNHQVCEDENLQMGQCASAVECQSACNCLDGFSCVDGRCVLGDHIVVCCLKDSCISGLECQMPDGSMNTCD